MLSRADIFFGGKETKKKAFSSKTLSLVKHSRFSFRLCESKAVQILKVDI